MLERQVLAGSALLFFASSVADSPTNKYEAETTHTMTFREVGEFQLDSMTQSVNGQEVNMGDPEMNGTLERSFQFIDEYVAVEEGRLTQRKRTFEDIVGSTTMSVSMMGSTEEHGAELTSPLSGETVIYKWDEGSEDYELEFDEDSRGDSSLLEKLFVDAEFQMIPPDDKVEVKDSWTIDLADQRAFFAPGGLLTWEAETDEGGYNLIEPQHVIASSLIALADASQEIDGELEVTWSETTEVDGQPVAHFDLVLEAELTAELGEELNRMAASAGLAERDTEYECNWSLEGKGTMTWNLETGHFIELSLECENMVEFSMSWEEDFGVIEVEAEVSGTSSWEAESE